jgi:hypothetical protein
VAVERLRVVDELRAADRVVLGLGLLAIRRRR